MDLTRIGEQSSFVLPSSDGGEMRVYCMVGSEGRTKVITVAEEPLLASQVGWDLWDLMGSDGIRWGLMGSDGI